MDQHGHVTIVVDDSASLRILREVAQRCGGVVGFSPQAHLALAVSRNRAVPIPAATLPTKPRTAPARKRWR